MSSCEKCWRDAHTGSGRDIGDEYYRLMKERKGGPCTPEQQAGPDAEECPECKRMTLHQHTQEPMCGCRVQV